MFASLIIVVPSLALPQAEYYHPGRALFQVQVPQGLFQLHSVGHHYPGPTEQVSTLWRSVLPKTPYSLWQTAQSNHVLPTAPAVALGPGLSPL